MHAQAELLRLPIAHAQARQAGYLLRSDTSVIVTKSCRGLRPMAATLFACRKSRQHTLKGVVP